MFQIIPQKEINDAIGEAFEYVYGYKWMQQMIEDYHNYIDADIKRMDDILAESVEQLLVYGFCRMKEK